MLPACIMWSVCCKLSAILKFKHACGRCMLYSFDVIAFEESGLPGVSCREQLWTSVQND